MRAAISGAGKPWKLCALLLLAAAVGFVGIDLFAFDALIAYLERHFSEDGILKPSTQRMLVLELYAYACFCACGAAFLYACSRGSFRKSIRRLVFYDPTSPGTPRPAKVLAVLVLVVLGLAAISVLGQYMRYVLGAGDTRLGLMIYTYFNLDQEHWVPTTFSSAILFYSGLLLANVARRKFLQGADYAMHWALLSLAFVYLSIDEKIRLHERMFDFLRPFVDVDVPVFWVVPAGILTLACLLAYVRFLFHLPTVFRLLFVASGTLYLGGAIGCEIVGRAYALEHGIANLTYELLADAEELLEMSGIVTFIFSLQSYLQHVLRDRRRSTAECGRTREPP